MLWNQIDGLMGFNFYSHFSDFLLPCHFKLELKDFGVAEMTGGGVAGVAVVRVRGR